MEVKVRVRVVGIRREGNNSVYHCNTRFSKNTRNIRDKTRMDFLGIDVP